MRRFQSEKFQWLEFNLLSDFPKVKHAIFLRHGGFSEGPYASLNVSYSVGDETQKVEKNIHCIKNKLKQEIHEWKFDVWGRGNHGDKIAIINLRSPQEIFDHDGLVTSSQNISLMMTFADCQIALFYDPKQHVVANIHSGWRGSVANIYRNAIQTMQQKFCSNPADLIVCISPSLGPNEAEFIHYQTELPEYFWPFQVSPTFFDFWSISEFQLQAEGILPHHIEVARLSTFANPHDFFSYRRDKTTGRHAACITLLP